LRTVPTGWWGEWTANVGPEVRKGAKAPTMLHIVSSFPVALDIIRRCFDVLTALAASGHLAYDALCCVSLLFPYPTHSVSRGGRIVTLLGCPKKKKSPGPEPARAGPV
jgi:hypothetical protein